MSLGRTEVKECNGCSRMTYCSKECQKKDWLNGGHNLTCNKDPAEVSMYHFQGRIRPVPKTERDATKLKALEINMTMIQQKLFLENAETILSLASSLNLQLCDCVVEFDLRDCPATIKTMHYGAYFDTPKLMKCFEDNRSMDRIICTYNSYAINGELDENEDFFTLHMQRSFQLSWLLSKQGE